MKNILFLWNIVQSLSVSLSIHPTNSLWAFTSQTTRHSLLLYYNAIAYAIWRQFHMQRFISSVHIVYKGGSYFWDKNRNGQRDKREQNGLEYSSRNAEMLRGASCWPHSCTREAQLWATVPPSCTHMG